MRKQTKTNDDNKGRLVTIIFLFTIAIAIGIVLCEVAHSYISNWDEIVSVAKDLGSEVISFIKSKV